MFRYPKRIRVHPDHSDEMVTKQSSKDECDIYKILSQYQRTGILTHIAAQAPRYEDLPDSVDYQQAMNHIIEADTAFATLPASVRDEYRNSPQIFLEAFADEKQHDRLRELGLLKPKPTPTPPPPPAPPPAKDG